MDFTLRVVSCDEDKGTLTVKFIPNPRRYEWKNMDGKQYLYDKLDAICFPEETVLDLVKQIAGKQIQFWPQEIDDADKYVKSRVTLIQARLRGDEKPSPPEDKSDAFLESLANDKLGFIIICVDIVGSTRLSISLESEKYTRLIDTVLYEISEVVPRFHGYVLKYTGDGLIAYFPEPSFVAKNDLALDCALTIRRLVYSGINPILKRIGYPCIDIRIGLDSGEAHVMTIGSREAKRHKDIIGAVVNLAAKIQSLGKPGDILLGDVTARNLHTMWREICEEIVIEQDWMRNGKGRKPYRIHKVKFAEAPVSPGR